LDLAKRELIGSVQDVGDLVAAHRVAVEARTRLELAAHSARLGPFEWHLGSDILWAGEVWWTNLGFANAPKLRRLDDLVGLAHPEDRRDLALAIAGFTGAPDATLSATFRLSIGDGGCRWVEIVARETTPAEADGVRRISGVLRDVNDERVAAEQALYAASHDLLTGLPNRAELKDYAASALARKARGGGSVAIMLLDLDRFKGVNDTFGHATGDAVLVEVAARLRECVRDRGLVARIGGDEFAILIGDDQDLGPYCAETSARIIDAVGRPISVGERRIVVGTSIGIAIGSDHGRAFDALLRNADAALYKAKASGKGMFCFFDDALAASEADRRVLQADLREAVERGEMRLHYQPEIDLATGRIRAVEALVRWMHPKRGLIPPDQFIPIAEETGLIVPIGNWVIETACRQAALWPTDVIVAVNLSAAQVGKVDLVHVVDDAIARAGIAPSRLEIEVTESVFLTADPVLLSDLKQLDAMGVRLALDDFGTGYSSLAYLHRLPFKRIKIDRSFVAGIVEDPRAMAIIRAIVDLAAALGADTTAEGVETPAQRRLLAKSGCTHAQGFLFSRPVPEINFGTEAADFSFRKEMGRVA
jgi:diguanylate cyclase (GGDEF)-like protein